MKIDHTLQIAAPASVVWEVVTDLASYPVWNPFVVACVSDLAIGSPITMRVQIFGAFAQPQREEILEHVPGERLCYGLRSSLFGVLSSTRCHVVRSEGSARTRYESHFELRGRLAPLVERLLGARLARGFASMTEALGRRAETLARERPQ